jgi:hypothetical protein
MKKRRTESTGDGQTLSIRYGFIQRALILRIQKRRWWAALVEQ